MHLKVIIIQLKLSPDCNLGDFWTYYFHLETKNNYIFCLFITSYLAC